MASAEEKNKTAQTVNVDEGDPRRELLGRILVSAQFCRAPKLQEFLAYVTERTIANELDLVTEQVIGTEVFKRKPGYSPGDDNIVRTYARMLRKRLDEYFGTEGSAESLVISIPRGRYAVEFHPRKTIQSRTFETPAYEVGSSEHNGLVGDHTPLDELPDVKSPRGFGHFISWKVVLPLSFCIVVALVFGAFRLGQRTVREESTPALHRFWAGVLGGNRTMIVPDDTGLTVVIGLIQQEVKPQEYVDGHYRKVLADRFPALENWDRPFAHRYTDLVDLLAVSRLVKMPEVSSQSTTIRYARDVRPEELDDGNDILLGGSNANPWVTLFDRDLNFSIRFKPVERSFEIINRHPKDDELASYPYKPYSEGQAYYGLVAVRPNFKGNGNVLLLEGVTNSGLQAAVDFCLDERLVRDLLKSVSNKNGSIRPFEVLVRTTAVGSTPTHVEVVGMRVH